MECAIRLCVRKCTAWPDASRSRRGAVFHAVAAGVTPERRGRSSWKISSLIFTKLMRPVWGACMVHVGYMWGIFPCYPYRFLVIYLLAGHAI